MRPPISPSIARAPASRLRHAPLFAVALLSFTVVSCGGYSHHPDGNTIHAQSKRRDEGKGKSFFQNVAKSAAVCFTYKNGEEADHYAILESLGGGGAALDYDGDGLLDLFLNGGGGYAGKDKKKIVGRTCRLYKNLGGWNFRDVTEETGLAAVAYPYSHGAAVGDYNCDGRPDLLVIGYGKVILLRNTADKNGAVKFVDATDQAGLALHFDWPTGAAFADFDGDGFCDLYICQYVNWSLHNNPQCPGITADIKRDICPPKVFQSHRDFLFRNDGNGRFGDVSQQAGLRVHRPKDDAEGNYLGKGLAVLAVDVNDDQKPDLYVANDTVENFLYLNESSPGDIRFRETARIMGVATDDTGRCNGSMGLDAADIDGSGLPSLWCTNYENELHAMYRMLLVAGKRRYLYNTQACGIARIGNKFVGWGTAFIDLENDGWQDLVIAHGHAYRHPPRDNVRQNAVLLRNEGDGKFKLISDRGGEYFAVRHRGRGLIAADFDNNGHKDFVVSHVNEPVAVLKNVCAGKNHWLGVRLAVRNHADVTGAKLTLRVGRKILTRFQKAGGSYAAANDRRVIFGLGPANDSGVLTVCWPSGEPRVERWRNLPVDRYRRLLQGSGTKK